MSSKLGLTMEEAIALGDRIREAQPTFFVWIVIDEDDLAFHGVCVRATTEEERKQAWIDVGFPACVFYTPTVANYGQTIENVLKGDLSRPKE